MTTIEWKLPHPLSGQLNWRFGRFIDHKRSKAFLVIHYPSCGKPAARPLELPYSEHAYPKKVMTALHDAGADIQREQHLDWLGQRLSALDVKDGQYLQKSGHHDGFFILAGDTVGTPAQPVVIDALLSQIACTHIGKKGSYKLWHEDVGDSAQRSSYLMFSIALALAAPIYKDLIVDEGVVFNLAGTSGLGKTTAALAARSVSGPAAPLFDWNATARGVSENLAACSDTLFIIDDWEKIDGQGSWSRHLQNFTHLMTSGASKAYANKVKGGMPDLEWSCPILTSGPHTVEAQAEKDGFKRSNGDRRRMIDIPVEDNDGLGIWDLLDDECDPGDCSAAVRNAGKNHYGHLLTEWLDLVVNKRDWVLKQTQRKLDQYCEEQRQPGDTGFEQTITRKFAIVYAAGNLAIRRELLPWDQAMFKGAVSKLYGLARTTIRTDEQIVRHATLAVNKATCDEDDFQTVNAASKAKFASEQDIKGFILETRSKRRLYITRDAVDTVVGGKIAGDLFVDRMKRIGAYVPGSNNRTCCQPTVTVRGKAFRPRMLCIELNAFDAEFDSIAG